MKESKKNLMSEAPVFGVIEYSKTMKDLTLKI